MRILFLSTWFPYPPNQGSKMRAYHLLKGLADHHQIVLISFEDVTIKPEWHDLINKLCKKVIIVRRKPFYQDRRKVLAGWLSIQPRAVYAAYSPEMEAVVQQISQEWQPDIVVALGFQTAPYASRVRKALCVIDIENLYTRWMHEAYQQARGGVDRVRRLIAWWKFERYEKWLYSKSDLCLTVSFEDRRMVSEMFEIPISRIEVIPNGANLHEGLSYTIIHQKSTLIYNGSLSYQANFDAMYFFLKDIYPTICQKVPDVMLKITGAYEDVPIQKLALNERVVLTGYLDDIKSAVASSCACVVPLRTGGGTRLKILEAMSLGTPVVSTYKGAEGLDVINGENILLADTGESSAAQVVRILTDANLRERISNQALQLVEEKYQWKEIQHHFCELIDTCKQTRSL